MEQSGEYLIEVERSRVWLALNDPDILQRCVAGCESMVKVSDVEFNAVVKAKVGPVRARFTATLELSDVEAPAAYTLTAGVQGGGAGFGKGVAEVRLADTGPNRTTLSYTVQANVGGKLAQVGSRLVDGAARKMADDFFGAFQQVVAEQACS